MKDLRRLTTLRSKLKHLGEKLVLYGLVLFGLCVFLYLLWRPVIYRQAAGQGRTGMIVGKYTGWMESDVGSMMNRYLLIEQTNGEHRRLTVTEDVFSRAMIGMSIDTRNGRIELSWPQTKMVSAESDRK